MLKAAGSEEYRGPTDAQASGYIGGSARRELSLVESVRVPTYVPAVAAGVHWSTIVAVVPGSSPDIGSPETIEKTEATSTSASCDTLSMPPPTLVTTIVWLLA
jgi:hypothetical protein